MLIKHRFGRSPFPRRTLFYLHLPKTGGTSVARALTRSRRHSLLVSEKADTKQQVMDRLSSLSPQVLCRIRRVAGHRVFRELQGIFPGEPVFATSIRNPVDLYVSLYNFWVDLALDPSHQHYMRNQQMMLKGTNPVPLIEWLESRDEWLHMYSRVLSRAEAGPDAPGIPLPEVTQLDIDRSKQFLRRCQFILETNMSSTDMPTFFEYCGISPPQKRARVSKKHVRAVRGSSLWNVIEAIVRRRSESDLELYAFASECRSNLAKCVG